MKTEFHTIIESALNKVPGNQELARLFISDNLGVKRFIIGKNETSKRIAASFKIDGVIDDYAEVQKMWEQVPIVKSNTIPNSAIVVNCSTSISPVTVTKNLQKLGIQNILSLHELIYVTDKISFPDFVEQIRIDYHNYEFEWYNIYEKMNDKVSKNTLIDIMCYRLTGDPYYMKGYQVRLNEQYFEDFMNYSNEVFADVGGFDGDTTIEFCRRYPDYKKVLLFEPSLVNMSAAKTRLNQYRDIEYIPCGLSDEPGLLSFNSEAGSASAIEKNGHETIEVSTLNIKITEPISFLKMDIEGWELKALKGSKKHIINDKPKLAIAVYHNSRDFWEIPKYILSLNPKYKIYLRHYTEGWSETVMYFVPTDTRESYPLK
jgi:FkbM family methyltransferase